MAELAEAGGTFTLGTTLGLCSGFALKKAGKAVAITVGGIFCLFQLAAFKGYVTIEWDAIERDLRRKADVNHDGVVDGKDAKHALARVINMLTDNMGASAAGFATGMIIGLQKG